MPPVEKKTQEKQGLLGLGFEAGSRLPFLSEEIPHRVGEDGDLEWALVSDPVLFFLNASEELRSHTQKKEERILRWIFDGWNRFLKALDGSSTPANAAGVSIADLLGQFPLEAPRYWEKPSGDIYVNVQKAILRSAYEYVQSHS